MKRKVLFIATVAKTHICAFHLKTLETFQSLGWETHVAASNDLDGTASIPYCDVFHEIPFSRGPFCFTNIKAYCKLKRLIDENRFDLIHCHTPVGGVLGRFAARDARKNGTKVIYTAHGFHFYHGAPPVYWLIFYPIEKLCARWTDALLTINSEDDRLAKEKMQVQRHYHIDGVGVDISRLRCTEKDRTEIREALHLCSDSLVLLSVGELNPNKNHSVMIRALAKLSDLNIEYIIAGVGKESERLRALSSRLGVSDKVHFLGYRDDVSALYDAADIFVFPSLREGLPVSAMEAMTCGLPVVCSRVRGNRDLIDENGGFLCGALDIDAYAAAIRYLCENKDVRAKMGYYNERKAVAYDRTVLQKRLFQIYDEVLRDEDRTYTQQ